MSGVLLPILAGAGVHLLAVMSPGPNFLVISRTALVRSRRAAFTVTLGVTTGAFVIIGSGFLGASAVVTRSERLFDALRLAGAAYLTFLGVRALRGAFRGGSTHGTATTEGASSPLATAAAYRLGLFTIFSNAKAFVYFVVFFTSVIPPDLPLAARVTLVVVMPLITLTWYSLISTVFSRERVRLAYARLQRPLDALFGGLLLFIGVEVALAL